MRVMSFKVDEFLFELIENYAKKKKITKSELIRRALLEYINNIEEKPYITRRIRVY